MEGIFDKKEFSQKDCEIAMLMIVEYILDCQNSGIDTDCGKKTDEIFEYLRKKNNNVISE
jgi:Fe-S cluster assembly ATPase SufC